VTPEEALAVLIERAPTGDLRVEACKVLSEAGDHRAVAVLLEALVDPTGDSHLAIATELVILGDRRACSPLIRLLRSDEARVREAAAHALGFLRCWRARDALARVLTRGAEDPRIRGQAAESLGYLLEFAVPNIKRRFLTPILEALADPEPGVRFWACFALALLKDKSAVPALETLTGDQAKPAGWWAVGGEAAWALAMIRDSPDAEGIASKNELSRQAPVVSRTGAQS
jgi:HEAT repeat protein